ncbi:MAG TPA: HAD family phosphatase [Trebonia sp.]|nr:HAD family phosphatase [Trebonia sp.]
MLDAVLFDMDGLLVDTEPLWLETETEVMAKLGAPWTEEDQRALLGGSMAKSVAYLLARARATQAEPVRVEPALPEPVRVEPALPEPAQVAAWLMEGMLARAAAGRVRVRPGARELLAAVAADGVPFALVTSSEREFADAVLAATGFRFPVTVTGDDVRAHKPDPEPYLLAASLLGADPRRCVALEDSPNGVASAGAAGCAVIAVPSLLPIEPAPGRVVRSSLTGVNMDMVRLLAGRMGITG